MRFWELVSVFRDQPTDLQEVLRTHPDGRYASWLDDFDGLCDRQDRTVLDREVPDDVVREALLRLELKFCIKNGHLRRADAGSRNSMSAAEVARRYGADVIEEVLEKGSVPVPARRF